MCFSKLLKHLWKFCMHLHHIVLWCGFNDNERKKVVCLTSLTEIALESSGNGPRV